MSPGMDGAMQRRLFGRGLLLQAGWSFERMQGLGFSYGLDPWLERCWGGREEQLRAARLRHQGFFNTQPHMSSVITGMICALEEELAAASPEQRPALEVRLRGLKTTVAAALAGLGDALFWGALRPACAALALAAALLAARLGPAAAATAAVVAYLVSYDFPALWLRWSFLRRGYEWGGGLAPRLKEWDGQRLIRRIRLGGLALTLVACGLALSSVPAQLRGPAALALAAAVGLKTSRLAAYRLYAGAVAVGLLAAAAGWL